MKLTKEYMIEQCQLTDEDFDGIDFDDFVSYFDLTVDNLKEFDSKSLLSLYRADREAGEKTDYTEIYQQASGKLLDEDIPHISIVLWETHIDNRNLCFAADFEKMILYGGEGYCLNNCRESDKLAELTEDDRIFVINTVTECGIVGWENRYEGTNEGTTGHFSWAIGFRLDSGKCVDYSGTGVLDSGTLDSMSVFCDKLWNHFMKQTAP
jgi:hypothetical protein